MSWSPMQSQTSSLRAVVVVQARMTSTRLPGKVLLDLDGEPLLARQIERLARCRSVAGIVIATTENDSDQPLVELANSLGVGCFRGSEDDVLSRYVGAAQMASADVVVRVTSDCPLIEPALIDAAVALVTSLPDGDDGEGGAGCDYASNTRTRTYPRGLDVEAFHADVLHRINRLGTSRAAREHVTWYLHREHPELFVCRDLVDVEDNSDLRWTVDTKDDLAMVRALWQAAGCSTGEVGYREILATARARPDITAHNAHIAQKER